jgi:undecaprenyl phosphate N,N'-diacetylbacillosamine 1-phosphate transferase
MYRSIIKPLFDLLFGSLAFIIFLPAFLIISLLLIFVNRGSPFFLQPRPGKNEKIFKVIKFKTMNDRRSRNGTLLPDSERLTSVGKIIRKMSLDEIPQLINVIKGDMSLIGPRPLLLEYLPLYSEFQKRRHEVRPGITGWAQVNGRNAMKFSSRFEYDVWYVDHLNFCFDSKIFFLTIKSVVRSRGVINGQNVKDVDDVNFNN